MSMPFLNSKRIRDMVLFACASIVLAFSFINSRPAAQEVPEPIDQPQKRVLRIAADPNNLPFSNQREEGFENKIARILAEELSATIEYTWRAQRRGFFRETMKEGHCNVVLGVPQGFERTLNTKPYYRSTYALIYRADRGFDLSGLDDSRLRELRIGVQLVGDDGINTPPAHALTARGIINNVNGFPVYGDYARESPQSEIVAAVANDQIDVAVVWGPLAGYFASRQKVPLKVVPLENDSAVSGLSFAFNISVGVRRSDKELRKEIDAALLRRKDNIERILRDYGVPLLPPAPINEQPKSDVDEKGRRDCCLAPDHAWHVRRVLSGKA